MAERKKTQANKPTPKAKPQPIVKENIKVETTKNADETVLRPNDMEPLENKEVEKVEKVATVGAKEEVKTINEKTQDEAGLGMKNEEPTRAKKETTQEPKPSDNKPLKHSRRIDIYGTAWNGIEYDF